MSWNPDLYNRFGAERAAPFEDLLALILAPGGPMPRPGLRVVDLGCGTGALTRRLAEALPGSEALGIDSSPEMLAAAAPLARPGLSFALGDQAGLGGTWDLIASNSALHWSDDHPSLFSRLWDRLAPGGRLAVQLPSEVWHPTHLMILETARTEPFRSALGGYAKTFPVLSIDAYARLLFGLGGRDIVSYEKAYPHVLADADAALEWVSGTALVPYFERIGRQREAFVAALRARFREAMPERPLFFPFRRTLFAATKGA